MADETEAGAEAGIIFDDAEIDAAKAGIDDVRDDDGKPDPSLVPGGMEDQLCENVKANRKKRWLAFAFIGAIVGLFFALLLAAFCKLFFGSYLIEVVSAANGSWQWHVLVFLGVSIAVLAAIPLSLSLAVVKMIGSAEHSESSASVKAPSVELVKALADIFKAVAASISKP